MHRVRACSFGMKNDSPCAASPSMLLIRIIWAVIRLLFLCLANSCPCLLKSPARPPVRSLRRPDYSSVVFLPATPLLIRFLSKQKGLAPCGAPLIRRLFIMPVKKKLPAAADPLSVPDWFRALRLLLLAAPDLPQFVYKGFPGLEQFHCPAF